MAQRDPHNARSVLAILHVHVPRLHALRSIARRAMGRGWGPRATIPGVAGCGRDVRNASVAQVLGVAATRLAGHGALGSARLTCELMAEGGRVGRVVEDVLSANVWLVLLS